MRLALTTHDSGGITLLDLALAGAIDRLRPDVREPDERLGRRLEQAAPAGPPTTPGSVPSPAT